MKKIIALLLTLLLFCGALAACSSEKKDGGKSESKSGSASDEKKSEAEESEVIVFAAASMTETLNELAESFKEEHPDIALTFNFDSSGTLKTQIEEGADCDLFISAAQKQMNELDATQDDEKNPDGLDFIDPDTRINLLENKVALCVPEGNPKDINSYDDMVNALKAGDILLAMGNSDVPVGQYTQKIFAYFALDEDELAAAGCLTYGSNVKEVATQVSEAAVDCGIIYQTDAYSADLTIVDTATEEMCGQVIYPAAILKESKNKEAAAEFLKYLQGDKANEVFEKVGFTPIK